jgi:hypothetical protein
MIVRSGGTTTDDVQTEDQNFGWHALTALRKGVANGEDHGLRKTSDRATPSSPGSRLSCQSVKYDEIIFHFWVSGKHSPGSAIIPARELEVRRRAARES